MPTRTDLAALTATAISQAAAGAQSGTFTAMQTATEPDSASISLDVRAVAGLWRGRAATAAVAARHDRQMPREPRKFFCSRTRAPKVAPTRSALSHWRDVTGRKISRTRNLTALSLNASDASRIESAFSDAKARPRSRNLVNGGYQG